mmetsp:Transcript_6810/g.11478  ORF Transcript_6810/g.11478 Transcript_6810/m.11478 type:complete len:85 (-) Transcript_6810:7-261(-)
MDVPAAQEIRYKPEFYSQAIQFWVQYLAVLIPIYYVFYEKLLGNAFRKNILESRVVSEIVKPVNSHDSQQSTASSQFKLCRYDF